MTRLAVFGALLLIALCPLASAQLVGYTAPADKAVWAIDISAPMGSTGTIDIVQENGQTTHGTWSYTGFPVATASLTLGSDSGSYTYVTAPLDLKMQVWNGDNQTKARQLKVGFGQYKGIWNDVLSTTIQGSPIVKYTIGSGSTIVVEPEVVDRDKANEDLNPPESEDIVSMGSRLAEFAFKIVPTVISIATATYYWGKFFLWDNLVLTIALWIALTGAISFNKGLKRRSIFLAIQTFFKYQRALFEFIMARWNDLVNLISNFRSIFRI